MPEVSHAQTLESMIRDLSEIAVKMVREEERARAIQPRRRRRAPARSLSAARQGPPRGRNRARRRRGGDSHADKAREAAQVAAPGPSGRSRG